MIAANYFSYLAQFLLGIGIIGYVIQTYLEQRRKRNNIKRFLVLEVKDLFVRLTSEYNTIAENPRDTSVSIGHSLAKNGVYYHPIFDNYISQLDVFDDSVLKKIYDFYRSLEVIEFNQKIVLSKVTIPGDIEVQNPFSDNAELLLNSIKKAYSKCESLIKELE